MFDAQPSDIAPGALQQHGHFASAWRACGPGPLILAGADPVLVLRRRLRGLPVAMLARAQLYEPGGLARRLREAGLHRHLVILSPDHPAADLARIGAVPVMTPAALAEIDLSRDRDARHAALHQKCRNRLRHAKQQGLRLTRQNMPLDPGHWLMRAEAAQRRTRTNPGRHLGLVAAAGPKLAAIGGIGPDGGAVDNWTG